MTESPSRPSSTPARVALFIAASWVILVAIFKLVSQNPNNLPPDLVQLFKGNLREFLCFAIGVELAVATLCIIKPRWGWFWISGMFVLFLGLLTKMHFDGVESCGCAGGTVKLAPWQMFSIDGVLLLGILATRPWKTLKEGTGVSGPFALLVVALLLALPWFVVQGEKTPPPIAPKQPVMQVTGEGDETAPADPEEQQDPGTRESVTEDPPAATGPANPDDLGGFVTIDHEEWVGKTIWDTKLSYLIQEGIDNMPLDGTWVIYRRSCEHCKAYLDWFYGSDLNMGMPVALIEINDEKPDQETVVTPLPWGDNVTFGSFVQGDNGPAYVVTPPVVLEVIGGEIISAIDNAEPPQ